MQTFTLMTCSLNGAVACSVAITYCPPGRQLHCRRQYIEWLLLVWQGRSIWELQTAGQPKCLPPACHLPCTWLQCWVNKAWLCMDPGAPVQIQAPQPSCTMSTCCPCCCDAAGQSRWKHIYCMLNMQRAIAIRAEQVVYMVTMHLNENLWQTRLVSIALWRDSEQWVEINLTCIR